MVFSGALTLTDLNDFITPSQACIKPVDQNKSTDGIQDHGAAATMIHIDPSGGYYESTIPTSAQNDANGSRKLQKAQISLNDCLACSGCITSAESVLISMQSHEEVLSFLASNPPPTSPHHRIPVVSIAPQSLASLAVSSASRGHVPLHIMLRRVRAFCCNVLGFSHVFDTTFARHIALLEHGREFHERKAARVSGEGTLPMLASACPGWVCYAEKTHPDMLPFIGRVKSPQQVMGTLVKRWMAEKWCRTPDQIYHVTVMPCYDKKLEASRTDFYNDVYKTRDVDCVITTGELELLMRMKGWDLSSGDECLAPGPSLLPELISHAGTSSGSYLHALIALVSSDATHRGRSHSLNTRTVRSADYEEYTLVDDGTGTVIFKGAKCYGFRNLQNVVRRVGKKNAKSGMSGRRSTRTEEAAGMTDRGYDYVEVMACPSGCVNGGGQIQFTNKVGMEEPEGYPRGLEGGASSGGKDWVRKVETAYWENKESQGDPHIDLDRLAARILVDICRPAVEAGSWLDSMDEEAEKRREDAFRTNYRKVESEAVGLAVKW